MAYTSQYPPEQSYTYVAATSNTGYHNPEYATNPAISLTGSSISHAWKSNGDPEQRFHIDLGSAKVITRLYYENFHHFGNEIGEGAKNFTLWGSNDAGAFAELTYAVDTNWTQLTTAQSTFDQHVADDVEDPKYITVTNSTAYRYYALKIADGWDAGLWYLGLRRIELQSGEGTPSYDLDSPLPLLTIMSGSDGVVEALPMLSILASADGIVGDIPLLTVDGQLEFPFKELIQTLPSLTMAGTINEGSMSAGIGCVPALTATGTMYPVNMLSLDEDLPGLTISATSLAGEIHEGDIDVPMFIMEAVLLHGNISHGAITLPSLLLSGKTSNMGQSAQSVPLFEIEAYAHGPLVSDLAEELPFFQIFATMARPSVLPRCYVMNTENAALSVYDNFPFNSFCTFKGKNLAAGPNGIMLLEGATDNGEDVDAEFNVGINDWSLPNIKKITDAYLTVKGDGTYYLKVTSDDGAQHSYLVTASGNRTRNFKTNIGKGKKGRYFELEFCNIAGADFDLQDITLNVELLPRKV